MKRMISVLCALYLASITTVSLCSCSIADPVETVAAATESASAVVTDVTVPSTAAATTALPESQPSATAVNWEEAYAPELDRYRAFAVLYAQWLSDDGPQDYSNWEDPWAMMGATYPMEKPLENFGYALKDIDKNGTPELILFGKFDLSISAIFTLVDGVPVLLGTYWPRNECVLDGSDNIYVHASGGAMDNFTGVYQIAADGTGLTMIEAAGVESYDVTAYSELKVRYYVITGDEKAIVSEEEEDKVWITYPSSNENSGLTFIPILTN